MSTPEGHAPLDADGVRRALAGLHKILWFVGRHGRRTNLYAVAYRCKGVADFVFLDAKDYADAWMRVIINWDAQAFPKGSRVDSIGLMVGRETVGGDIII